MATLTKPKKQPLTQTFDPIEGISEIIDAIELRRDAAVMGYNKLAELAEMPSGSWYKIVNGPRTNVPTQTLAKAAKAVGLDLRITLTDAG